MTCRTSTVAPRRPASQAAFSTTLVAYCEASMQATIFMALSSMGGRCVVDARLAVNAEAVDHRGAGFVEPDDLDMGPLATELQHRLVERRDRRDVPEMRAAHVDGDGIDHLPEVEGGEEARSEEHTSELQSLMRISYAVFRLKKK